MLDFIRVIHCAWSGGARHEAIIQHVGGAIMELSSALPAEGTQALK